MKTPKHSLRKIVSFLNNPDEDGGFWLPNIQRPFVWNESQIYVLFDSILREYPISTLLVWKTYSPIRRRKFIDNFRSGVTRLTQFYVPVDEKKKCLVLDGQQRLQSLYIGLKGSFNDRELYFDILSGDLSAPEDVRYKFEFLDPGKVQFPWVRFKDLVYSQLTSRAVARDISAQAGRALSEDEVNRIDDHVSLVFKTFHTDDGISYQELDSTENDSLYREDDVVEVFIRANSGGTKLGKSDLLFSLLSASWDKADEGLEVLLDKLNRGGFQFTRDFVLKTCLTLLDQQARYEVSKFRKPGVRDEIETRWDEIADALKDVVDFLQGRTFIRSDKAIPSYLALIPLVYLRFHFKAAWRQAVGQDEYLLRSFLAGAFGGTPDQLIDDLVRKINEVKGFDLNEMFGVIRSRGRSLEIAEDRLWSIGYGSDGIHLLFNLWYRTFNYTPAYNNNLPQVDHIFPASVLRSIKKQNPNTGRWDLLRYYDGDRNQLANCMLLTAQENGAGAKSDTPPEMWFANKPPEYLELHLIPKDPALWKIDRFEDFIEARKHLIRQKFSSILQPTQRVLPTQQAQPSQSSTTGSGAAVGTSQPVQDVAADAVE